MPWGKGEWRSGRWWLMMRLGRVKLRLRHGRRRSIVVVWHIGSLSNAILLTLQCARWERRQRRCTIRWSNTTRAWSRWKAAIVGRWQRWQAWWMRHGDLVQARACTACVCACMLRAEVLMLEVRGCGREPSCRRGVEEVRARRKHAVPLHSLPAQHSFVSACVLDSATSSLQHLLSGRTID